MMVHTEFIQLLFSVLSYVPTAMAIERQIGTVSMVYRFFSMSLVINIIYVVFCGFTGINQPSMGLWPLLFADLVLQCMQNPTARMGLCCLPIAIPAMWYPVVLIVLFTLFAGPIICMYVGLGVGYLYHFGYFKRIEIEITTATRWETKFPFKKYTE